MCKGELRITLRGHRFAGLALLSLAACASPAGDPATAAASAGADAPDAAKGQFISQVLPTGEVAPIDPILAYGITAPHTHAFFGAENVTSTSTWSDLKTQPTTAQNSSDTAAYWVPQLYMHDKPWNPGCTGSPPQMTCGNDTQSTYYVRAYYTTPDPVNTVQMPRLEMVTGYPGATADPYLTDPTSMMRVHYTCGATRPANNASSVTTPLSRWPYSCNSFRHPSFDGVVMIVDFPSCWNGHVSRLPNGERAVRYIDPNVDPSYEMTNDLAYATDNACPTGFPLVIPQVSLHIHTLKENPSSDGSDIWPSDCGRTSFPCQTQSDPPATLALGLASDAGTPGGWYTFHADFVQSWHMGTVTDPFSTQPPPDQDANERPGTLNDLTEDCLIAGTRCSFQADGGFVNN